MGRAHGGAVVALAVAGLIGCEASGDGAAVDAVADAASPDAAATADTAAADGLGGDAAGDAADAAAAVATASGHAFNFGPAGGRIEGATVRVLELPDRETTTGAEGAWSLTDLPVGADLTFVLEAEDHPPYQTATFVLPEEGLERVSFQSPDTTTYNLMAGFVDVVPDSAYCQIATTVTRRGNSLYDETPGSHGEPGATVTIDPPVDPASGPIYFNLITYNAIYPDPALTETSHDGGVLYLNVPEGDYTLTAHKADTTFTTARIQCRPGFLVNASPPWGLQALEGGIGPRDPDSEH